jgi:hypothetical protein
LISASVCIGAAGCGSDASDDLERYFRVDPYPNAACNKVDQSLAGRRQLRLFFNGGVHVEPVARGLANYYHRHSLSFFTDTEPQATTMAYALDTDRNALGIALVANFPDVDFNDEAALMADRALYDRVLTFAANFLLKPMVDFASAHSEAAGAITNVIVVPQLERPGNEKLLSDSTKSLAGLAISPALLAVFASSQSDEAKMWQGVQLPSAFSPMMVLGDDVLTKVRASAPDLQDLVVAHEFGHTGALTHTTVPRNLMYPSVSPGDDCTDSLDDSQLATMSVTYGLGPAARTAPLVERVAPPLPAVRSRILPSFTPDRLRALLAGDQQALRSFVDMLFQGGGPS